MDTYVVPVHWPKRNLKYKVAAVLINGVAFFILWFSWSLLWPDPAQKHSGVLGIAVEGSFVALIWAILTVFVPLGSRGIKPSYKLLVDEDSITGVTQYGGWMKWFVVRKTIRRGEVCSIFEINARFGAAGGVGISKRSPWGARLFGFVYLPKSIPEFESLKRLMESWRSSE